MRTLWLLLFIFVILRGLTGSVTNHNEFIFIPVLEACKNVYEVISIVNNESRNQNNDNHNAELSKSPILNGIIIPIFMLSPNVTGFLYSGFSIVTKIVTEASNQIN